MGKRDVGQHLLLDLRLFTSNTFNLLENGTRSRLAWEWGPVHTDNGQGKTQVVKTLMYNDTHG